MEQYRDGQYYYARHRNMWGVWQYHSTGNGDGYGEFIDDFPKRDDALYEVYKRNGWKINEKWNT